MSNGQYASYASLPENSRGRQHPENSSTMRDCFQRDRDRIVHSAAFRRLGYKTQVFVNHEGDHYRTRLTHSIEVAHIARTICRALGLNEDLAEAIALAHDLGHTPFGHPGEEALQDCVVYSGNNFNHNGHALKILTKLEQNHAGFDGLNLTWETLEGVAKHNGPVSKGAVGYVNYFSREYDLCLDKQASAEAQVAAIADDIAYNSADIDDGLRAGLFTVEDICRIPLIGGLFDAIKFQHPDISKQQLIQEVTSRLVGKMVEDVIQETTSRVGWMDIKTVNDVRNMDSALVGLSSRMFMTHQAIKKFLKDNMYSHYQIERRNSKARRLITDLFEIFRRSPECLPTEWRDKALSFEEINSKYRSLKEEVIADYIAGMTDRFAMEEHKRLFGLGFKG